MRSRESQQEDSLIPLLSSIAHWVPVILRGGGAGIKYRLIEFFVFDYGSLPYLLSLFF